MAAPARQQKLGGSGRHAPAVWRGKAVNCPEDCLCTHGDEAVTLSHNTWRPCHWVNASLSQGVSSCSSTPYGAEAGSDTLAQL